MAQTTRNKVAWIVFICLAIGIGLYPLVYLFASDDFGLLLNKSDEIRASSLWKVAFYGHISLGGIALLVVGHNSLKSYAPDGCSFIET